ncbi:MAG TPA: DegV family protein [Dehalococcoidia bacterium]|nr:DegV family protein [Dehalococcoidia bacterium]
MDKIALITDSIACFTREMVERYGIRIVPSNIHFDGSLYKEYLDISPTEAYHLLERDPNHFSTSAPSPADYLEAYRELSTRAQSIICITLSAKPGALHDTAQLAKEQAKQEIPRTAIEILDSRTRAAAEGFVVLATAMAIEKGKEMTEAIKAAENVRDKVNLLALMETIRHAYRSGRIPKIAERIGSALSIKPIISISDGAVDFVGLVRTKERGAKRSIRIMREKVGESPVHVAVVHADALEEAQRLKERVAHRSLTAATSGSVNSAR